MEKENKWLGVMLRKAVVYNKLLILCIPTL